MSMKDIRDAFAEAADGRLQLKQATLHYTAVNGAGVAVPGEGIARTHQILRFAGTHLPSGKSFSVDTAPIPHNGDLSRAAAMVARGLIEKYDQPSAESSPVVGVENDAPGIA